MTRHSLSLLLTLALLAVGCKDDPGDSGDDTAEVDDTAETDDTGEAAVVESITLSVNDDALIINETAGLMVTATLSDGSTQDLTPEVQWSISDPSILGLEPPMVRALAEGSAEVTATYEDQSASVTIAVSALSITGEALLHGYPIGELSVTISGDAEAETWTDATDGSFAFEGLGVGSYTVTVNDGGGRSWAEGSEQVVALTEDAEALTFTVEEMGYPTADDAWEGDDTWDTASSIAVDGALQARSLWPYGAYDWIAVELTAGTTYELFTTGVCATCDTYLELYDSDGETRLNSDDDYLWLDSDLVYEADTTGTHYIRIRNYNEQQGVANYFLGVLTYVDADEDSVGAYHDCDDSDSEVHPFATEIGGDGIDNDCDGYEAVDPSAEDASEPENDASTGARPIPWTTTAQEPVHMGNLRAQASATLHATSDVDWWSITLPPYSKGYVEPDSWREVRSSNLRYTYYDVDGETQLDSSNYSYTLTNETGAEQTYYVAVSIDTSRTDATEVGYAMFIVDEGLDADGDGYTTMGWAYANDCDDSDDTVTYECYTTD